jgi:beta-alanine--pyruvate transaminase
LAGIDLETDGVPGRRGFAVLKQLFNAGLVARVTNDTIILAPPFVATETQIREMVDIVRSVVAGL